MATKIKLKKFKSNVDSSTNGTNVSRYDFPENAAEPNPAKKTTKIAKAPSQIENLPNMLNLLLNTNLFNALNSCLKSR